MLLQMNLYSMHNVKPLPLHPLHMIQHLQQNIGKQKCNLRIENYFSFFLIYFHFSFLKILSFYLSIFDCMFFFCGFFFDNETYIQALILLCLLQTCMTQIANSIVDQQDQGERFHHIALRFSTLQDNERNTTVFQKNLANWQELALDLRQQQTNR